jgi:hypothetical protein
MTDRELLELAAKAAEYNYAKHGGYIVVDGIPGNWNPLTDDGDALRLAVKLNLFDENSKFTYTLWEEQLNNESDLYAATRRAIVRAAAAIGEKP